MKQEFDPTLFDEALTPEARRALQAVLDEDPALAAAFERWRRVRIALRAHLEARVPDRHLLVLYALARGGRADVLEPGERAALEAAREDLDRALAAHPALHDVIRRIQADADAFEAVWEARSAPARPRRAARGPAERPARPPRRRTVQRWSWRVGAVAAVTLFAVVLTLLVQRERGMVTLRTGPGEVRLVELAGGSTVRLMGGSELTYADPTRGGPPHRRARLRGRAFFDIAPDGEGFTVETPVALATVLGTRFGVQAGEAETEVVLVTGRLALAPRSVQERLVVLEPGQMSRVAAGALPSTPVPVDLTAALDWTGLFLFRATPLPEVLERLSDHYGVPVTHAPALAGEAISGTFEQDQALPEILETLAAALGAEVRPAGNGWRLER
ncbi:FecR domain-containing protein [Rhodocaloribacter litoris]|uniref:FecR domain-containing protein n=1 Tax=Rhodocaloribacter litoris TaxID=2558931 RepID=UPI0014249FF1|nr:FecR domain-containing protein [Rhodocaloribacter litoris]QXD14432.1 FecR domain-containing protein [Rhodocaloribacter litoris]